MEKSKYRCNKCRDMTFIIDGNEAVACECRQVRIAEDILRKSGISEEFRNKRFNNFRYSLDRQLINAHKEGYLYARNFKEIERDRCNSIMFMGQVGSGKTHLSLAIANELMDQSVGVVYMSYREVITVLKQNIMFELLNFRYFNRLPVIVSCEMDVESLLRIDEGIGSRLVEMCRCVEIRGKRLNYRINSFIDY